MKSLLCTAFALLVALTAFGSETTGQLEGTIVSRDVATNRLTVAHGDVPGIMAAMTMPYEVRGQRVDSLPADGTTIKATLHADGADYWLTDITEAVTDHDAARHTATAPTTTPAHANHEPMQMPTHHQPMHDMTKHDMPMESDATSELLMRHASGRSMNPAAAPMHMSMSRLGEWDVMLHGLAFVNQVQQSGPRGRDKLFSTNWIMAMADRKVGTGHLMLRTMLSLEPVTVGAEYPELFQTGEVNDGRPIIDAQHPHNFFMELAADYARPLAADTIGYLYVAPHGDPALGPVAYPHRASASEIPQSIGANFTLYSVPDEIQPYYGDSPTSAYLFLRLRSVSAMGHGH